MHTVLLPIGYDQTGCSCVLQCWSKKEWPEKREHPDALHPCGPSPEVAVPTVDGCFYGMCSQSACSGLSKLPELWPQTYPSGRFGLLRYFLRLDLPTVGADQDSQVDVAIQTSLPRTTGGCSEASSNSWSDHSHRVKKYILMPVSNLLSINIKSLRNPVDWSWVHDGKKERQ